MTLALSVSLAASLGLSLAASPAVPLIWAPAAAALQTNLELPPSATVAPETVAPETVAPETVASEAVAPEPVAAKAAPEELRRTESDGLGLSAGLGSQYVLLGIQASYYFQIPHSLYRIVPYVAVGGGLCGTADSWTCSVAAGMLASWGHKHRITLNLEFAPLGTDQLSLHGEGAATRSVFGPLASLGYEYMTFSGFYLRTDLGIGYATSLRLRNPADRWAISLTLIGLGFKL